MPSQDDFQYDATPYQRYGHTAVAYNESAYIWGGRNDVDGACNKLYEFNTCESPNLFMSLLMSNQ